MIQRPILKYQGLSCHPTTSIEILSPILYLNTAMWRFEDRHAIKKGHRKCTQIPCNCILNTTVTAQIVPAKSTRLSFPTRIVASSPATGDIELHSMVTAKMEWLRIPVQKHNSLEVSAQLSEKLHEFIGSATLLAVPVILSALVRRGFPWSYKSSVSADKVIHASDLSHC